MGLKSVVSEIAESVAFRLQHRRISRRFRETLGYEGNFANPKTHQEKIQFRKLYGNHAFYASVADKYGVRRYVAERVGDEHLIPLLGVHDQLRPSVFDALPSRFIIKATHGCKWNKVVLDKSQLDVSATVRRFNHLVRSRYGRSSGEKHYALIPPRIVIEELLEDDGGGLPWDYSFFCYNGPSGFDWNFAICSPQGKAASFTREWEQLSSNIPEAELTPRLHPANFDRMVEIAKALSAEFDFIRVDLYSVGNRIYFGELTCTPHQGYGLIKPERRQRMRDEMWHLDADNPRLYVPAGSRRS